jgi:hypothetical protein
MNSPMNPLRKRLLLDHDATECAVWEFPNGKPERDL